MLTPSEHCPSSRPCLLLIIVQNSTAQSDPLRTAGNPSGPGTASPETWTAAFDAILREHCRFVEDSAQIACDVPLPVLGVDSLDIVELIVELEEGFGFSFPEEMLTPEVFATAGSIWAAVRELAWRADG
jgi:acyl carrier protein